MAEVIPFKKPIRRRYRRPSTRKAEDNIEDWHDRCDNLDRLYAILRAVASPVDGRQVCDKKLIEECIKTGDPDAELMMQVLHDLACGDFTVADIFAIYLYRKKIDG